MPNGDSLWGSFTSTQAGVIVQQSGNSNKYYLFTCAPQAGYLIGLGFSDIPDYAGIAYSVVDMTLNSGNGDIEVASKNTPLLDTACEKITAVRHCNGTDIWIIVHKWNSDAFYSYLLTTSGIQAPVISHVGDINKDVGSGMNAEAIGYLKASPNGKKLASAINFNMNEVQLFDFNNLTGIISNPITINYPLSTGYGPYGVSFSPDNHKLYTSYYSTLSTLFQYNISSNNQAAIIASQYIVSTSSIYGSIQAAPDGKLYVADDPYISVINNPNILGAGCNFVSNAVNLDSGICIAGLPNFIDAISPSIYKPDIVSHQTCQADSATLDAGSGYSSYLWSPDGDTTQTITIHYPGTYTYSVSVTSPCGSGVDTITFTVHSSEPDTTLQSHTICQDNNYNFFGTNLTTAGIYYHKLTSSFGCDSIIKLSLAVNAVDTTVQTQTICQNNSYTFYGTNYSTAGEYYHALTSSLNCDSIIKLSLVVNPKETVSYTESPATGYTPLNVNFAYTGTTSPYYTYSWNFGDGDTSNIENPSHVFICKSDTTFTVCLTVTDSICKSDTCKLVKVDAHSNLIVYNVFTPNGDGKNDEFMVRDTAIATFNCIIFNRWGNKIYEWSDVSKGWDGKNEEGKNCSDGTYYYIITAKGYDNKNYNIHGVVTLIR